MVAHLQALPTTLSQRLRQLATQRAEIEAEIARLAEEERREAETLRNEALKAERISYKVAEVADLCGVSRQVVLAWMRDGLPSIAPVGGNRLILRKDLVRYLEDCKR